jgi:AraC family transcriptional regulator
MQKVSKIYIKGMVCNRCVQVVSDELQKLGYPMVDVRLGEVSLGEGFEEVDLGRVEEKLAFHGLTLLEDWKRKTVKAIRQLVQEVYNGEYDFPNDFKFFDLIKRRWNNYDAITDAFTSIEKKTLERYIIDYRIDRVRQYLVYSNYTLLEIASRLNFNSVSHLSAQFKLNTGFTPSNFRELKRQEAEVTFSAN